MLRACAHRYSDIDAAGESLGTPFPASLANALRESNGINTTANTDSARRITFTLGLSAHRSNRCRSSGIARFVQGGVVKTFRTDLYDAVRLLAIVHFAECRQRRPIRCRVRDINDSLNGVVTCDALTFGESRHLTTPHHGRSERLRRSTLNGGNNSLNGTITCSASSAGRLTWFLR